MPLAITNYLAGQAAEGSVERLYAAQGASCVASRWRGQRGEIDLVLRDAEQIVFVEVKKSKSHHQAARHLSSAQVARIFQTAEEYLARHDLPMDTDMRFDVALVDRHGAVDILENALAA